MLTRRLLKIAALIVTASVAVFAFWPGAGDGDGDCCHIGAAYAQDPPEEEQGNPDHVKPEHHCSDKPIGKQVACKCRAHKKCDSDGSVAESRTCKSWCWRRFCLCPDPVCP